jgi:hypothetical protein
VLSPHDFGRAPPARTDGTKLVSRCLRAGGVPCECVVGRGRREMCVCPMPRPGYPPNVNPKHVKDSVKHTMAPARPRLGEAPIWRPGGLPPTTTDEPGNCRHSKFACAGTCGPRPLCATKPHQLPASTLQVRQTRHLAARRVRETTAARSAAAPAAAVSGCGATGRWSSERSAGSPS